MIKGFVLEIPLEEQQQVNMKTQNQVKPVNHNNYVVHGNNSMPNNGQYIEHQKQNENQQHTAQQKLQMRRSFPILDYDSATGTYVTETNQQTLSRRHSEDLLAQPCQNNNNTSHFTRQLLVNSAGDILMDNNLVPPPTNVAHRVHQPGCIPPEAVTMPLYEQRSMYNSNANYGMFGDSNNLVPQSHTGSNPNLLQGSNPNLLQDPYTAQPFSPMDTNSCDGSRTVIHHDDRIRDPHLSASSIRDSEPSLNKVCNSMPNNTAQFLRKYEQPLAGSPRQNNYLIKSASQELLSNTQHIPNDQTMQVDDLKWLDLTSIGSPLPGPSLPLNHGSNNNYHSSDSILGSEGKGDGSLPLSTSLQSFGSPSPFIGSGLSSNDFTIDLMDLNSFT